MNKRLATFGLLTAAISTVAAVGLHRYQQQKSTQPESPIVGQMAGLPSIALEDLDGHSHSLKEWAGKVIVLNFWATWCPPCRKEIPGFIRVQQELGDEGLQIIGIAVDEKRKVSEFVKVTPLNYPVLMGGTDAIDLARSLGNRFDGLPFTVIFDRADGVVHAQAGELSEDALREKLDTLL